MAVKFVEGSLAVTGTANHRAKGRTLNGDPYPITGYTMGIQWLYIKVLYQGVLIKGPYFCLEANSQAHVTFHVLVKNFHVRRCNTDY